MNIPIHLLRQWAFCPRVAYYQELLGLQVAKPLWVKQGENRHELLEGLLKRRSLRKYGVETAKLRFNQEVSCTELGVHGTVDALLETDAFVFPIEFKTVPKPKSLGHRLQVWAYMQSCSERFDKPCPRGFLVGNKKIHEFSIDHKNELQLHSQVSALRAMLAQAVKPSTQASVHQCAQCEYYNFCNDR